MLFPTIQFAIFFPIVFILAWLLRPYPTRWKVLMVIASYVFYGWWDWHYVFLLGGSTIANQIFAKLIAPLAGAIPPGDADRGGRRQPGRARRTSSTTGSSPPRS